MRADEADSGLGSGLLDGFGDLAVVLQRRRAGVDNDMVVALGLFEALVDLNVMRGAIQELRIGHQRGWLREPSGVPEAGDLAPRLVARAGAAVEAVERRGGEEKGLHSVQNCCVSGAAKSPRIDLRPLRRADFGEQFVPLGRVAAAATAAAVAVVPVALESGFRARQAGVDRGLGFGEMALADGNAVEGLDLAAGVVRLGMGREV